MNSYIFFKIKIIVLATFCIAFITSCRTNNQLYYASSDEFKDWYSNQIPPNEKILKTWYHFVVSSNSQNEIIVRTFYPVNEQLTSVVKYKTTKCITKDGNSIRWYDNGFKESEGAYKNNLKIGFWRYYQHKDTSLVMAGEFKEDLKTGVWKYYWNNGKLSSQYTYKSGIKEGEFIEYDSLSKVSNEGIYKADTIFKQTNLTMDEQLPPLYIYCDTLDSEELLLKCSSEKLLSDISKIVVYPKDAIKYDVQGYVKIYVYINKDGEIADFEILNGLCGSITSECKRVIKTVERFERPSTYKGKPEECVLTIPITFRLR